VIAVFVKAQNIPSYVPTNGLVGWWPFNGNANDESGNGNNGIVNGATLTSDRNGVAGKAYSFNPSQNSHILVPFSNSLNSIQSGITLSAWIFMDGGTGAGTPPRILELRGAYGGGGDAGFVMLSQSNSNQSRTFELRWYNNFGNSNVSIPSTSQTLSALNWHNIIFTGDGTTGIAKCYFDGVLIQTITQNIVSSCNYNNNPLVIGAEPNLLGKWGGKLDDIAIYNRALTHQEITTLYSGVPNFDITSSSGPNGSITPTGTITLNQGSTQGYTFTPNTGYTIDSVIVDGNKVDSIQGYTFSNISANHSIRVNFKVDSNNVSMNFPTGISYQAVARDSAGKVLANSSVKLRFSIKENSMNGNTVYTETANLTTNKLGLFTCVIGNNNATNGNYKNLDWMGASKFLQVELEQGNSFVLLGTQQLLSVPYANAAKEATKIKNAALPIYNSNSDALQGGLKPGEMYRTNAGILMIVY